MPTIRSAVRALAVATLTLPLVAGSCPLSERPSVESAPADAREVVVRVGESEEAFDGAVRVHLVSMQRWPKEAKLVVRLESGGQVQQQELDIVWTAEWSDAVRLEPWAARIHGYPGVDAARFAVWREEP